MIEIPSEYHYPTPVLDVFGSSPFGPFVEHAKILDRAIHHLHDMLLNFTTGKFETMADDTNKILEFADEADMIKQGLISILNQDLLLPIPREELLLLIRGQDRIAAHAYNVAFQLDVRHTKVPNRLRKPMKDHIDLVAKCVDLLLHAVQDVERVLRTAFSRKIVRAVVAKANEVQYNERLADKLKEKLIVRVFGESDTLGLLGTYHLLKIIELADRIAHHAKHTSTRLASIVARE